MAGVESLAKMFEEGAEESVGPVTGAGQASCRLFFTRSADFRQLT